MCMFIVIHQYGCNDAQVVPKSHRPESSKETTQPSVNLSTVVAETMSFFPFYQTCPDEPSVEAAWLCCINTNAVFRSGRMPSTPGYICFRQAHMEAWGHTGATYAIFGSLVAHVMPVRTARAALKNVLLLDTGSNGAKVLRRSDSMVSWTSGQGRVSR